MLHKWTFNHLLKYTRTPCMLGPSQSLKGPQRVPGDPCPPEINMGNLKSAPKPQCQTPGSPTTSTQALPSFECSVCEERSRGRWVLTCCGVGGTFQLTKCSAAGLPSTQAGCSIGWGPPKGGHTPGGDGSPLGLAFCWWDQAPPTSLWQRLTTVATSCSNLLVPGLQATRIPPSAATAAHSYCCQQDLDPSRTAASLDGGTLRASAVCWHPSANE